MRQKMGLSFHAAFPAILASSTLIIMICFLGFPEMATAQIRVQNVTRLCHTKTMVTVNGKFPGPRIIAREGDRVIVKVENHVSNNISIHWDLSSSFLLRMLLIHFLNHINKSPSSLAGEWWNSDTEAVISQALQALGRMFLNRKPGSIKEHYIRQLHIQLLEFLSTTPQPHAKNSTKTIIAPPPPLPPINSTSSVENFAVWAVSSSRPRSPGPDSSSPWAWEAIPAPKIRRSNNGTKFAASVNNVSFTLPTTALLHSKNSNGSEFTPQISQASLSCPPFNYTGTPPNNTMVANATKVVVLPYVQHHRGAGDAGYQYSWRSDPSSSPSWTLLLYYVVGQGFRNFDLKKDPPKYNLVDPVERKPSASELTILEGKLPNQKLLPPPSILIFPSVENFMSCQATSHNNLSSLL
nr:Laccase-17 [Ipomoea batatas]